MKDLAGIKPNHRFVTTLGGPIHMFLHPARARLAGDGVREVRAGSVTRVGGKGADAAPGVHAGHPCIVQQAGLQFGAGAGPCCGVRGGGLGADAAG
jgi:hypothetical protein